MSKYVRWSLGAAAISAALALILLKDIPFLFDHTLPHVAFFGKGLYILLLACFFCVLRIVLGPTVPDRIVTIDVFGILLVGLCALLTITTGRQWYMDIGIAWALQGFVSTLAYAKFIEGKRFDE